METELSRLLDALPAMVWTAKSDGTSDFVNRHWLDYTGLSLEGAVAAGWTSLFHPDDLAVALAAWELTKLEPPREIQVEARLRRADGVYRRFDIQTRPLRDATGRLTGWCGISTDVEDRRRAEAQLAAEKRLLERVARGLDLPMILDEVCVQVEGLSPGSLCSILFVDPDRRHFRVGAGPNLPDAYNAALDGLKIDPSYGPCSLAVETRTTVIASDPSRDPRWEGSTWPALIAEFGLASCWSAPIYGSTREVLGIFAIYRMEPRGPSAADTELIDRFVQIAGIAMERSLADTTLKANAAELRRAHDHLAQAQRLSQTGSFTTNFETDTHAWSDELYRILEFEPGTPVSFKTFRSLIHPDDQALFTGGFQSTVKSGVDFDEVFRFTTPRGAAKYLRAVAKRIESGATTLFMGSIQDVTESKLAEEALKANEAELRRANHYLRGAQRLSKTASFTWDVATDELDWSEEMYRIWEIALPQDCAVVPALHLVLHPDDVAPVEAIMAGALEKGASYEVSYRIITPSGAIKHLRTVNERLDEIPDRLVYVGATQDLTDSRLVEEALRTSEAEVRRANRHLRAAQTLSRIGSFTWNLGSDELDWSDETYRIWEIDPAVTPTLDILLNAIHPDDVERVTQAIAEGKRTGGDIDVVYRIITPSGVVKHLHTVSTEINDQLLYVGSTQDVTESKIAEAALKTSEAAATRANRYLKGAQTLSRIGSFTWDVEADAQDWSDENFRIWEFDPSVAPTMSMVLEVIHPDDLAAAGQAIAEGRGTGEDFEIFYRIITRSGVVKHLHTMATRVPEVTDRLVYIGSTQDVTASKLAEADLARANTYLVAAQSLSQTGSFTWDVAADEHNWSDVIYKVFGFEPGIKITMAMMMRAIHPEDVAVVETLIGGAAIGQNFELVFRVITPTGELRYAHVMGHRIDQIPDRPVFMGALQDITARKLAEDDLNRTREELAHVSRVMALSTLTASIAHEVSQPLAGIITNSSTCLRMLAADPPDIAGALTTVQRTLRDGNRASEVIKRLRALYGRRPLSLEPVDLQEVAREVLALLASELQRRRVRLRAELVEALPTVAADRIQLQQVILNLILNAADAMIDVVDRTRELRVSAHAEADGLVTLEVRDCGVGLEVDHIDQLFKAFHTTKADGMGIGLSVSRSIIEAHGGRLTARPNAAAPGATFSFSLPRDASSVVAGQVLRQA